jgi:hypothetical protein
MPTTRDDDLHAGAHPTSTEHTGAVPIPRCRECCLDPPAPSSYDLTHPFDRGCLLGEAGLSRTCTSCQASAACPKPSRLAVLERVASRFRRRRPRCGASCPEGLCSFLSVDCSIGSLRPLFRQKRMVLPYDGCAEFGGVSYPFLRFL